MKLSKVYRGYVIEQQDNGQWLILNAPSFTNSSGFSPGPHNGWTVATHQVDKLLEYMSRGNQQLSGWSTPESYNGGGSNTYRQSSDETSGGVFWIFVFIFAMWLMGVFSG